MIIKEKHKMPPGAGKIYSFVKSIIVLCLAVLFFQQDVLFAQVISNAGAAISVSTGAFVNSKDFENTAGTLGNNGTINLTGNYFNAGSTGGSGYYNIVGNWTNLGLFSPGTSTVTLNGNSNQTITHGSLGETFYRLTINNPGRIVTQITTSPGNTLSVLNNLNITAGTLSLDQTTSKLVIVGRASITGALIFNNNTSQTTTIGDILSGPGLIDMSGGNLPHVLNLAGATNAIGTFTTSASGSSTVNYNGTTQTVFPAANYRNLTISNSGIKTLQDNSTVGINLNISGGTFDLGTTTTTLGVLGTTTIDGSLSFSGTSTKTVSLTGSLSGTGSIDMSGGNMAHILNLNGATNIIGTYSSGTGSTVDYIRNGVQTVFTSNDYRNLKISGNGVKTLYADITAKGILTMSAGDINPNGNTLKITNSSTGAIIRTAGIVIGKLQRAIGITGSEYLYPIGSSAYNPLKMTFQNLTSGPLTAQFKAEDIGTAGLPLDDDGNEIYDRFTTGYWSITAVAPMASGSFNVNLNYTGFPGVDLSSSIIKRTNGGNLELDGVNGTLTGSEITRTSLVKGISTTTTDLAIGKGQPRITDQPQNIDICDGSDAFFEVKARGRGTLTYQWQVDFGSGFTNIINGGVYSGATNKKLILTGAPYSMNGYLYRCIITDGQGHPNTTNTVLLTVNKIPVATVNPSAQNECPGVAFANILLGTSNGVTGTTFAWTRDNPAGITTSLPMSGSAVGDQITGIFSNTTNDPITVTFTIIPTGPATTFCVGLPITASVTVNPIPRVFAIPVSTIQCDSTTTSIQLTSPSTFTSGLISFRYSVTTTGSVTGFTTPTTGLPNNHYITDKLINQTDQWQVVTYRVVPVSPVGCVDGPYQNVTVTVNPTPRVIPVNLNNFRPDSSICYGGTTDILLTSPTVMTSGVIRFDYIASVTGAPGVIIGDTVRRNDLVPGQELKYSYQNNSDTIQSVYYAITPKVTGLGCNHGNVFTSEIKVHPRPLPRLPISIDVTKPLTCSGGAGLASLRAIISKGANPYQIEWFGPITYHMLDSVDITNLNYGKYVVNVTDNLGCFRKDSISIVPVNAKAYISADIVPPGSYNVSCIGSSDGTILVAVTGGITPPYRYWVVRNDIDTLFVGIFSNNLNLVVPTTFRYYNNLPAASYTLIIRDKNGCEDSKRIVFRVPPVMVVGFGKSQYQGGFNISCKGYNDGSAWVQTITGGRGSYTYRWYTFNGNIPGPKNTNRIDNITTGKYYLETKDILNCVKTDSVLITEPDGMQLSGYELSKSPDGNYIISCNGGNDGYIKLNITGGSGTYINKWTGPGGFTATTKDISGLFAGTYTDTIKDLNGCKLIPVPSFTLSQPNQLNIAIVKSLSTDGSYNINCNGGTGSISLTLTGGSIGKYKYNWSTTNGSGLINGQEDQNALTAGTYNVTVTDSNRCVTATNIILIQPQVLSLVLNPTHITCQSAGFNNGSVDLTVSGGIAPYLYSWSNGATSEDINGLTQGYYKVTVSDVNGCPKEESVRILPPPPIAYSDSTSSFNGYNISCYGLSDGLINISPSGGEEPFVYNWQGPGGFVSSNRNISDLKAGQYNLLITDNNLCTATGTFNLTEPGKLDMTVTLSASIAGGYNINCAGDSTGTININAMNQVISANYLWSDGSNGKSRANLPAGVYKIIITDNNNCHADSTIILTAPDSIKLQLDVTPAFCPDSPDGQIKLKVTGGYIGADFKYKWSDNSVAQNISNIMKGLYWINVTDDNNCSHRDTVKVEPLNETCLIIPNAISPNDDNINDVWNIGMIYLYPQIEIKIFNRWGELLWKSERGYPKPWDGRSNGTPLPIDSYHYIIDLHNGTKPIVGNVTIVR